MTQPAHRVVVADDHPLYRSALGELFGRTTDFTLVGAVEALEPALELLAQQPCDVALLDLRMPGMDGLAGVQAVRSRWPGARIVLISGNLEPDIVAEALAAGVSGFLPKSFDPEVILAALRLVMAGAIYVPHELAAAPTPVARDPEPPAAPGELTPRELEVLAQMAQGATYKEIARALGIAEITIKLHAQRIARKLGAKNRAAAIATAVKAGLLDLPPH